VVRSHVGAILGLCTTSWKVLDIGSGPPDGGLRAVMAASACSAVHHNPSPSYRRPHPCAILRPRLRLGGLNNQIIQHPFRVLRAFPLEKLCPQVPSMRQIRLRFDPDSRFGTEHPKLRRQTGRRTTTHVNIDFVRQWPARHRKVE
jgi:hypothetical protein